MLDQLLRLQNLSSNLSDLATSDLLNSGLKLRSHQVVTAPSASAHPTRCSAILNPVRLSQIECVLTTQREIESCLCRK